MSAHKNVEIKAKAPNGEKIRKYLESHATKKLGVDHQIDTYFNCYDGRLKPRQGNIENTLIHYKRSNQAGPKVSEVNLFHTKGQPGLKELLRASNGIKVVVDKHRDIFFIDNVKFHIDDVVGLGHFVEIEAIDEFGELGFEHINQQCQYYLNLFEIKDSELVEVSYSDLLLEKSRQHRLNLEAEFTSFSERVFSELKSNEIDYSNFVIDHVCYRVESDQQYQQYVEIFELLGELLGKAEIAGREISTFKLHKALNYGDRSIDVVELPMPKAKKFYSKGFEHFEFVLDQSFDDFVSSRPQIEFDLSGVEKTHNPEIRQKLFGGEVSLKFHHTALEQLVLKESLEASKNA